MRSVVTEIDHIDLDVSDALVDIVCGPTWYESLIVWPRLIRTRQ